MTACAACGETVADEARFCHACGAPLERDPREERKVVTVLFCDLVDFTSEAEKLDPEDVQATLRPYHERVRTELERFGGTVEKFVGDAVMALFGAPAAREDDPERAVRAALAIRDAAAELNELSPPIELRVRIGVNTGEALVSLGRRPAAGEGMAAGDVVNTAARLEQAAAVNGILVGETTYRATRDAIAYGEACDVPAKGKAEPVRARPALATRAPSGADVLEAARTPLVGREEELHVLRDAFARTCREQAPQLVTLVGVPGIGKSRLVGELAAAVERESELVFWRQGRSLPYGDGVTFWALGEMTKAQAGILHSDGAAAAAAKLAEAVRALTDDEAEAHWLEARLRPLVGLDLAREGAGGRGVEFAAWRRFFEAMAERRPLVLVFEDLHWADDALLDFVDELVDRAGEVPLLVVATTRPELYERRPGWGGGKRNATTISLAPLADAETSRLLRLLLERAEIPEASRNELLLLVGGVPLCAEEYVRMLEDRGLVRHGRLTGELPLPETVQGIIAARLDALTPDEKALVQAAAVVGRSFWLGALVPVAGIAPERLDELLPSLERKELLRRERRSTVANERQYSFWHVLVRDVAYAQIPRRERAEKHRRAAEWIERLERERADDWAEMVAHHYCAALDLARASREPTGELAQRARTALREAGDRAAALSAFAAAARFYGDALALWPADDPELELLRLRYGRTLMRAEREGAEIVADARDALLAGGAADSAAEAEVVLAEAAFSEGRHEDAVAGFRRAQDLVAHAEPSPAKAFVLGRLAGFMMADGHAESAVTVGTEAAALAEQLDLDDLKASALLAVGVARTYLGDAAGFDDLKQSLSLAERNGDADNVIRVNFNLGSTYANVGDLPRAYDHYARGAEAAARLDDALARYWFAGEALYERWWRGEWDDALTASLSLRDELGDDTASWIILDAGIVCGSILSARGELDSAARETGAALAFAREAAAPQALVPALAAAARIALDADDRAGATTLLLELLDQWRETEFVPGFWTADAAVVAAGVGHEAAFEAVAAAARVSTRWLEAARAYVAGNPAAAADLYARIGSRRDEAFAHLAAGQREQALAFFRSVGAARVVERGSHSANHVPEFRP